MPGLVAVVVVTAVIIGPAFTRLPVAEYWSKPLTRLYFWNIALAPVYSLPGVFDQARPFTGVNGSLWSLPVEVTMYFLLLLYGRTESRFCRTMLLPWVLAGALAGAFWFTVFSPVQVEPVIWWNSVPFGLRFASDFVLGAAVCVWRLERFLNVQAALLLLMALGLTGGHPEMTGATVLLVVPYAVLSFGLASRPVLAWAGRRADVSYGVYLWGCPVQQMLISGFGPTVDPLLLTALALPLSCGIGWVSWRLVEAPALRWKPRGRAGGLAELTRFILKKGARTH